MDIPSVEVRRLGPQDAALYRDIRLDALQANPEAYGSTYEAECVRTLSDFAERLSTSAVIGAFRGPKLVGIAGLLIRDGAKEAHKGLLWGMYVQAGARGEGIGRRIAEAIIDFARGRVEIIQLSVVSSNTTARRLYSSLGFVEYGLEKNALRQNGRYYDEVWMAKDLREPPSMRS